MPVRPARKALRRLVADLREKPLGTVLAHPTAVVACAAAAIQTYVGWRVHAAVPAGERLALRDSVIFEYIGRRLAAGDRLYVDVWEIKPPLSFELTWLLATLSGGDVGRYHDLVLIVTGAAAVSAAVLVCALVQEVTGDGGAAIAAGLVPYGFPAYPWRATVGFKAKYFVVAAGLFAVYLNLRGRDLGSGLAAGAAAGFWQVGVGFPVVVGGLVASSGSRQRTGRFVAGLATAGVVVLAPVLWWGTLDAMVAETVVAPLLVGDGGDPLAGTRAAVRLLDELVPVVVGGMVGLAWSLRQGLRPERGWAPALGAWFGVQVLLVDLDAAPDLFALLAVTAVGVGILLGGAGSTRPGPRRRVRQAAAVGLVLFVAASATTLGGYGLGDPTHLPPKSYDPPADLEPELPYDGTEGQYVFWTGRPPASCRLFAGPTQIQLVEVLELGSGEVPYWETDCGRLRPALDALVERYW